MRIISTIVIGVALWGPPLAAIIANRTDPDIATALGVPYGFVAGLLAGAVTTVGIALAALRWQGIRPYYWLVAIMIVAAVLLFTLANRGSLSVVS